MAMVSPTDFMEVVRKSFVSGEFFKGPSGYLDHAVIDGGFKGSKGFTG
jgi:hypothetical protein